MGSKTPTVKEAHSMVIFTASFTTSLSRETQQSLRTVHELNSFLHCDPDAVSLTGMCEEAIFTFNTLQIF